MVMARRLQSKGEGYPSDPPETAPRQQWRSVCNWCLPSVGHSLYGRPNLSPASPTGFLLSQGGQERRKPGQKVHRAQRAQIGVCPLLKRALCLHLRYLPSNIGSIEDPAERTVLLALIIPCGGPWRPLAPDAGMCVPSAVVANS